MSSKDQTFIDSIRAAAPYVHAHRGKTFVLQLGGEVIRSNNFQSLIHDIALLNSLGVRLVIVYGARPQIADKMQEKKFDSVYVDNLRVTEDKAMECVKEAVGVCRIEIEALLSMGLPNSPMAEAEIKVASGNYVTAKPAGVVNGIDLRFTGKVRRIDHDAINTILDNNEIVLISSLGYSPTGETFNLSSIEVATRCAVALSAEKLLFVLSNKQITDAEGSLLRQLTQSEAEDLLVNNQFNDEIKYHIEAGIQACKKGVNRIHYIDEAMDGALLKELFSRDGIGTLLSASPFDQIRQATVEDVGGILELLVPLEEGGVLVRRSREKLEEEINDFSVLIRDGAVIACGVLHFNEAEKIAEVACLVVAEKYRNENRGEQLLASLENTAIKNGAQKIFLLTTHTDHWFLEQGFSEALIQDLPVGKQKLYNFQRNSKVLIKSIQ